MLHLSFSKEFEKNFPIFLSPNWKMTGWLIDKLGGFTLVVQLTDEPVEHEGECKWLFTSHFILDPFLLNLFISNLGRMLIKFPGKRWTGRDSSYFVWEKQYSKFEVPKVGINQQEENKSQVLYLHQWAIFKQRELREICLENNSKWKDLDVSISFSFREKLAWFGQKLVSIYKLGGLLKNSVVLSLEHMSPCGVTVTIVLSWNI